MNPRLHNEKEVLRLMSEDSEYAFHQVYDHYRGRVYRTAYKMLRDRTLSEEVVQEVFLRVWRKRADSGAIENYDSYLYKIVQNCVYDQLQVLIRNRDAAKGFAVESKGQFTEAAWLFDDEFKELLNQAVEKLPHQQKQVFRMAKDQGLSHEAIGKKLNISRWTVKNHMTKAITTLYAMLKPHILKGILVIFGSGLGRF